MSRPIVCSDVTVLIILMTAKALQALEFNTSSEADKYTTVLTKEMKDVSDKRVQVKLCLVSELISGADAKVDLLDILPRLLSRSGSKAVKSLCKKGEHAISNHCRIRRRVDKEKRITIERRCAKCETPGRFFASSLLRMIRSGQSDYSHGCRKM